MTGVGPPAGAPTPADVAARLVALLADLDAAADDRTGLGELATRVAAEHRAGARNLLQYLALRRHDLRELQDDLTRLGLSSLGRSEGHVRASVAGTLAACRALMGEPFVAPADGFDDGDEQLEATTSALLGPEPEDRRSRIMVTLPSSAADDGGELVGRLLDAGAASVRINTAHDDPRAWRAMARGARRAAAARGTRCVVLADLGGPKLRTGPFVAGPRALRLRPRRDEVGRTAVAATAVLAVPGAAPDVRDDDVVVPVEGDLVELARPGDELRLRDLRGRRRRPRVVRRGSGWIAIELDRTTWLATGTRIRGRRRDGRRGAAVVGELPERPLSHRLRTGDELVLVASTEPVRPAAPGQLPRIGCSIPAAVRALRPRHRVLLDDGAIEAEVLATGADEARLVVTRAAARGSRLRADKGINLPDTELVLDSPGPDDLAALDEIGALVDVVGMSFVRSGADVERLLQEVAARSLDLGLVLKIETPEAFAALPELLLTGMRTPRLGVMIARGDLAVEAGFERTAELQEEILWACEAAHVPSIWATQVLERLAKDGVPSRAEVTDAAMAGRAECVMLNKGDHIDDAVRALAEILDRMSSHQRKKTSLMRRLESW